MWGVFHRLLVAAHDQRLFDLQAKYADVVSLEETLAYLNTVGAQAPATASGFWQGRARVGIGTLRSTKSCAVALAPALPPRTEPLG